MRIPPFLPLVLSLLVAGVPAARAQGKLHPGDTFELRVTGVASEYAQEVSLQYMVLEDGTVRIPYIGRVKAAGSTVGDFSRAVERQFVTQKIFTNPTVVIALPASARTVNVGGGVRSPGAIPWSPELTLSEAINRAGGCELGGIGKVKVVREGKTLVFDLRRSEKDRTQNPNLDPGDEVKVPE